MIKEYSHMLPCTNSQINEFDIYTDISEVCDRIMRYVYDSYETEIDNYFAEGFNNYEIIAKIKDQLPSVDLDEWIHKIRGTNVFLREHEYQNFKQSLGDKPQNV